jgi:hypothetical protein
MMTSITMRTLIFLLLLSAAALQAAPQDDGVAGGILAGGQPRDIFEVRRKLLGFGGKLTTHIVGNRGHENPESGSFSFFESYAGPTPGGEVADGELFIGFFTERQGDALAVQQSFDPGLMIELIAWDRTKKVFNFWELVGTGSGSQWHYRGDSNDVLADVAKINTGAGAPVFGRKLRCSGCHTLGGPIMKEIAAPHNDWWTDEGKLALGSMKLVPGASDANPQHVAAKLFAGAKDASNLARLVKSGTDRMLAERAANPPVGLTRKHQLRSLLFAMEMNLVTDARPFRERVATGAKIEIPASFFVDERLTGPQAPVAVDARVYAQALKNAGSSFAADEAPGLAETRHAFNVPARSYVDQKALDALVAAGLAHEELIADVLAVDFTTPVYSSARGSLIQLVPETATSAADLHEQLVAKASKAPREHRAAQELLANLTDPARDAASHRARALAYLTAARNAAGDPAAVADWLEIASQRRVEVAEAETSKNPRGTILEPGFRVIFPVDALGPVPGKLMLDPATARAKANR